MVKHNDVVADIPNQQKQCSISLWAHMRSVCDAKIVVHTDKKSDRDKQIAALKKDNEGLAADAKQLEMDAAKLNSQTVNTTKVMQDINRSIASAGFRGFELREKPGAKYVYGTLYCLVDYDYDTVTTRIWEEDYSADAFSEELVEPYMEKVVQDAAEIYAALHDAFQEEADEFLAQIEKILSALQYALDFTERWESGKVNPEIDNT